jgi:phage-related protein
MADSPELKPLFWIRSTHDDLRRLPSEVRQVRGYALYLAQCGDKHLDAKPLKGFGGGAGVLEVVADHDGDAYRAVYTVRFADAACLSKEIQTGCRHAQTRDRAHSPALAASPRALSDMAPSTTRSRVSHDE